VGIAIYSLQFGPRLVVTFTTDRAQLARGIDTLGLHTPDEDMVKNDPLHFIIAPPTTELTSALANEGRGAAAALRDETMRDWMETMTLLTEREERHYDQSRILAYASGLEGLAHSLASVPGRKQVVLFSEGFDSRLLLGNAPSSIEAQEDDVATTFGELWKVDSDAKYGSGRLQSALYKTLESFRRSDCAVQAIDIGGIRADTRTNANDRTPASGEEALFYMANETGGALFRNANDLGSQLTAVMSRTDITYVLTFERGDLPTNGAWHKLKVEVKNLPSGARVSYRPGYYGPRPYKDLDPLEKNLLAGEGIATAAPRREVVVHALAAPFRQGGDTAYVPIVLEIDGNSLLVGHPEGVLDAEIYAYASNAHGEMRDFFTQRLRLDLAKTRAALQQAGLKFYGHLDLQPGDYRIRVLVRDSESGRTGVESVTVTVPEFASAQPYLLPPFLTAGQQGWMLVREHTKAGDESSVVYPFTIKGDPYVPAAHPVLAAGRSADVYLVGYNLGAKLQVHGQVLSSSGAAAAAGKVSLVERTASGIPGLDKLVATFDPAGLGAGDYVLQVAVEDTESGRQQRSSLPITIR
jgi:VWFA-related protein